LGFGALKTNHWFRKISYALETEIFPESSLGNGFGATEVTIFWVVEKPCEYARAELVLQNKALLLESARLSPVVHTDAVMW